MMRPGKKVNSPATTSAGEERGHRLAMPGHVVTARMKYRQRQHHQRKDGDQMNRAPRSPNAQLVNPESRHADRQHEQHPNPSYGPMGNCPLRGGQLDESESKRRDRRKGVQLNRGGGIQERCERDGARSIADTL
jgi:hypothetical protein